VIAVAAVGTGIAVYAAREGGNGVEAAARVPRAEAIPATPKLSDLPARRPLGRQRGDLFAAPHSSAPPAPPPQQQEQAAPTPPPNPYRFAGTLEQGGVRKILLIMGASIFEAKEGEMLEQNFRVQSVTADAVTLVYVPLDTPVTVALAFPDTPASAAAGGSSSSGPPAGSSPAVSPPVGSPLAR